MNKRKRCAEEHERENHEFDLDRDITVCKNNIHFYTSVNRRSVLKLNSILSDMNQNECFSNINLYIQSEGGDVYAGLSAMSHIKKSEIDVYTYVDGLCASAATFMSIAGKKRFMFEFSELLIHQIQSETWGRYEDMKNDMENNKKLMIKLRTMYELHTKIPTKKLNELLTKEVILSSNECLKFNIIDEII
jgi:ATP-dependent protease ClpP protease subunit